MKSKFVAVALVACIVGLLASDAFAQCGGSRCSQRNRSVQDSTQQVLIPPPDLTNLTVPAAASTTTAAVTTGATFAPVPSNLVIQSSTAGCNSCSQTQALTSTQLATVTALPVVQTAAVVPAQAVRTRSRTVQRQTAGTRVAVRTY